MHSIYFQLIDRGSLASANRTCQWQRLSEIGSSKQRRGRQDLALSFEAKVC